MAILSLACLGLFSLADLRYRVAPGIELFFLSAALVGAFADPLRVGMVLLAVSWSRWRLPPVLALPALLHPSSWAVLLAGTGVRRGAVGDADLLALGGLACLFDWPAPLLALVGVEVWRLWWRRARPGPVPAMPGMLLGLVAYCLWGLVAG